MAIESKHRLVVIRSDGLSHSSDFAGWHSETGVYHFFNQAKADKRTLYAAVFYAYEGHEIYHLRSEYKASEISS